MGRETKIAWTESTLNLCWGCTKVSRECTNCYMYRLSERFGKDPYKVVLTRAGESQAATEAAIKKMGNLVFINSMSDTFHKDISDDTLDDWFAAFASAWRKQFQILTKRPERAAEYFRGNNRFGVARQVPRNCWIGTSVGIREALPRIDALRRIHARIRFLSCEPLLEDLGHFDLTGISWVIIGGESDDVEPRIMELPWAEHIIDLCRQHEQNRGEKVAVFFKQVGGKGGSGAGGDVINGRRIQEYPNLDNSSTVVSQIEPNTA